MTVHDLPQIKRGIWTTTFLAEGHQVIQVLNYHDRIQTEEQASECAKSQLFQFNPQLEWDECETTFTSELSL